MVIYPSGDVGIYGGASQFSYKKRTSENRLVGSGDATGYGINLVGNVNTNTLKVEGNERGVGVNVFGKVDATSGISLKGRW